MKFCIATIIYFQSLGFDTTNWRKSSDGQYAIVHYEFLKILKPDLETDMNIQIKEYQSADLDNVLISNFGNEAINIEQLRLEQITKMSQICQYKIINEFYSACLGESKKFDCELTDQINIQGLVAKAQLMVTNPAATDNILEWKASGEPTCYPWEIQQVIQLGVDLYSHVSAKIKRFEQLRIYITDAARTMEELEAITWDSVI